MGSGKRHDEMPAVEPHFMVVSLGNPKPYLDTLHSAGHLALLALQRLLSREQPHFTSNVSGKPSSVSAGPKYTLVQSPATMNVSGPWVAATWKKAFAQQQNRAGPSALVLVHDDLESELGAVRLRSWSSSPRGHNGAKSVKKSFSNLTGDVTANWARITVGIGRPEGRDQTTVSDYVLRKMTRYEMVAIEAAAPRVLECLMELEAQWGAKAN